MSWDSIGSVDTGSLPDDREWIHFCQKWAINYIRFVCGQPPAGVELDIMQHEHELGDYPSIGVWSDFYDAGYVGECERALESLNNAIDWYTLKKVYETSIADAEDEYFDDEEEDAIEAEKDGSDLSIVSDCNHSTNEVLAGEVEVRDGFYGTWRTDEIQCSECDWKGTGEQCVQGEMFKELFELDCPNCSRRLMAIPYPTIEESRANWDRVSEEDKRQVEAREEFLGRARETMLTSPEELPDLDGDCLYFVWDKADDLTVIRYGDRIIWTETCFYEGHHRWVEVAEIFTQKYGNRMKDLIIAQRAMNYIYGDTLFAEEKYINPTRKRLEWR